MPFTYDRAPALGPLNLPAPAAKRDAPSFFADTVPAAFRQENLVTNMLLDDLREAGPSSPMSSEEVLAGIEGTKYAGFLDEFDDVVTTREFDRRKRLIDRELADRQTLADSGVSGFLASMGAGVLDAPSLIPGAAAVRGGSVLASASRVALASGIEAAGTEAALQGMQQTRTAAESAVAIGGSVVLGGILGAGAAVALGRTEAGRAVFAAAAREIDNNVRIVSDIEAGRIVPEAKSGGAAAVAPAANENFLLPTKSAQALLDYTPAGLSFNARMGKSQSAAAKRVGNQLLGNEYAWADIENVNTGASVEYRVKTQVDSAIGRLVTDLDRAKKEAGMTRKEFAERVGRAMDNGDLDENPIVIRMAQDIRRNIVEPETQRLIRAGMLDEQTVALGPLNAKSYFPQVWIADAIDANTPEFMRRMKAFLRKQPEAMKGADEADIDQIAQEITYKLTNQQHQDDPFNVVIGERGPFKERTLHVNPDDFREFLDKDAEHVLERWLRTTTADRELQETFGDRKMLNVIKEVRDEYDALKAAEGTTEAARKKLNKERDAVIGAIEAARDIMRGNYMAEAKQSKLYRAAAVAKSVNVATMLGGMTISAFTDAAKHIMTDGLGAAFSEALPALMKDLRAVSLSSAVRKRLAAEAGIYEKVLASRFTEMADVMNPNARRSPFESFVDNMTKATTRLSGVGLWNQWHKQAVIGVTMNKLGRMAKKADLSEIDATFLRRNNINTATWNKFADHLKAHGEMVDGQLDPHLEAWPMDLKAEFTAMLRKEADTQITTPGIGDKIPSVERNPSLSLATQFKSFALSAWNKTTLVGLQGDQKAFMQASIFATAFGMFVYYLKSLESPKGASDNPGTWIAEGLDRSGMIPMIFEINNMAERLGIPGIYAALGTLGGDTAQTASRYQMRSPLGAAFGPSASLLENMFTLGTLPMRYGNAVAEGKDFNPNSTLRAGRNLIPGGRLPGVRGALDLYIMPELLDEPTY